MPVAIFATLIGHVLMPFAGRAVAAPIESVGPAASDEVWFAAQVLPVLRRHCFECHSHGSGKMKGGLALDWRSGWSVGGDNGPAVVPGKPDQSLLIRAVRRMDPDLVMPPKAALADAEVAILVDWVRRGAPDPRAAKPMSDGGWWSLKPLTRPAVPSVKSSPPETAPGAGNPIDAFILARLTEKKLAPSPAADRRTLLRRVSFDLIGLPPTPEEVAAFVADTSPAAYERVVDRLLASPRYGERWARHWLDAVHFADTHGFEHDLLRPNAWRYRDYAIDALNRDTPWPRFIREQLAADAFYPDEPRLIAAMGFLGAGPYDQSAANTAPRMFEYLDRDDLVNQTMAVFAGTTIGCARCHAHKFDPISQEDYFAVQAVFAGIGKGEIEYDEDPTVAGARRRWKTLLDAANSRNADVLLAAEHEPAVAAWERSRAGEGPTWVPADVEVFTSTDGSTLRRLPDATIEAIGPLPQRDTYTLTVSTKLPKVTALRLDVLADPSLPKGGPGRAENGNLHLSEFEVQLFRPKAPEPRRLKIRRATADWNQDGWAISGAIDGDPKTAWGIHPRQGQSHYAVFELDEAIELEPGAKLVLALRQLHGGGHLIGRLRPSATSSPGDRAIAVPAAVASAVAVVPGDRSADQRLDVAAHVLGNLASAELARIPAPAKVYAAGPQFDSDRGRMNLAEPRPVHVLRRGDIDQPGAAATPGALSAVAALQARFNVPPGAPESARRAALADWLADPGNPLTWRSVANRVWHHHFGRGLCDTPDDLGRMGGTPSHPELLDWLACEIRDGPADRAGPGHPRIGSLKHLHRLIVTSATYQQSSAARPDAAALDAENRLLWRTQRRRLDAESYRDAVLAVAGRLDLTAGGPGVQQFALGKPVQLTPTLDYSAFDWDAPGAGRRSIYRVVWRAIPDPFMESLDFPDPSLLAPVRGFSASPQQALAMLNNSFILRHAEHLASRAEAAGATPEDRLAAAWRLALQREASPSELTDFAAYAAKHGLPAACRLILNLNEFLFLD